MPMDHFNFYFWRIKNIIELVLFYILYISYFIVSAISCGDAPTNPHITVNPVNGTYGQNVTYTCDSGYTLQGSETNTCSFNDTTNKPYWINEAPICAGNIINSNWLLKLI